ncbi:MAG: DnaJ domain-containing protein [Leptospiraceae bacterium]|nr:DnaJ domain-containing protein [Leptospiraceae bacterium]MCB1304936.1 DnaJ domain-containing protein [Leptospiraceae bacterium]
MPSVFVDHYHLLGVNPAATREEIQKAFRKLAKVHHPDKRGGDPLRFHCIYTAYRILSDEPSRRRFDEVLFRRRLRNAGIDKEKAQKQKVFRVGAERFVYPASVAALARKGLLRKKFRSRDRRRYLKIDYDLELPLLEREMPGPLRIFVPVVARILCPDCLGSDTDCYACGGKGSYKASRTVRVDLEGGLGEGQILQLDLTGLRPDGPLSYFKKKQIRIKITCIKTKLSA